MIGLDTNILIRHLLQDDAIQSPLASRLIELPQEADSPYFVSVATIMEVVWVLHSRYKATHAEIGAAIEYLLFSENILMQNESEVFAAMTILREGLGSFEDALIAGLGRWIGCRATLTFDRKAARLPGMQLI